MATPIVPNVFLPRYPLLVDHSYTKQAQIIMFKTHDTLKIMPTQNDNTTEKKNVIKLKRDTSSGTVIADVYCI